MSLHEKKIHTLELERRSNLEETGSWPQAISYFNPANPVNPV